MQGTAKLESVTTEGLRDEETLQLGSKHMYLKSIRRLKHYKELGDKVINTYLKSCTIPSLYAQCLMDNDNNYISDHRTIVQLSRLNLLEAKLVFLPIARQHHWSLATANMCKKQIYHKDPISGTMAVRSYYNY